MCVFSSKSGFFLDDKRKQYYSWDYTSYLDILSILLHCNLIPLFSSDYLLVFMISFQWEKRYNIKVKYIKNQRFPVCWKVFHFIYIVCFILFYVKLCDVLVKKCALFRPNRGSHVHILWRLLGITAVACLSKPKALLVLAIYTADKRKSSLKMLQYFVLIMI